MVPLFAATLFLSAALMFSAEPMIGKLILPVLGGAPAVWNTCVMFFQFELLAGYVYAHVSATRLGLRAQSAIQVGLLATGVLVLPLSLGGDVSAAPQQPILTVVTLLARSIGLPLFAIAATAPLLQRWIASTRDPAAKDPFFLYAASNLGSLIALLSYPLLLEPTLRLVQQRWAWSAAYLSLVGLTAVCAWKAQRQPRSTVPVGGATRSAPPDGSAASAEPLTGQRRLRWLALAFVPSSLMLSVTTYIATDIAAVPLLWVVPLALYLLTFVFAFARKRLIPLRWFDALLPLTLVLAMCCLLIGPSEALWFIPADLAMLFMAAALCHGQLADERPTAQDLTEYYLWISLGGLLGGVFNTLVAPRIFTATSEYPVGLVLVALLRPRRDPVHPRTAWSFVADVGVPVALGSLVVYLSRSVELPSTMLTIERVLSISHLPFVSVDTIALLLAFGLPLGLALLGAGRRVRFALTLAAFAVVSVVLSRDSGRVLHEERTFFGTHRISDNGSLRVLTDGTTMHGAQSIVPGRRCEPVTYYAKTGPIGQLFASIEGDSSKSRIAAVGLGAAALSAYARPTQQWTFFEINPAIVRIAENPSYLTYLRDCVQHYQVVVGDARLEMALQPDRQFDLMLFDAFSSDAIPIHLVTREAFALYLRKLAPRGILVFHISNRYLELSPVLGDLARDAGLSGFVEYDADVSTEDLVDGKLESEWAILARRREDLGHLIDDPRWEPLDQRAAGKVWTDDYSNILATLRFRSQ